ncbi:MAG: C-terminal binding protein [Bryobacteraceae bacterium]|jgi:phosphoglycerate dehydrogenase-like enzyme
MPYSLNDPVHVFVLDCTQVPHVHDAAVEQEVLRDCAQVHLVHISQDNEFRPYCADASALIVWHHVELTANIIRCLTKTRIIVRNGVGFENIDVSAAAARGIAVSNVPDYGTEEVADHAITLSLALNRQLRLLIEDVRAGNWHWETAWRCRRVRGQIFGVVGCGRIGTATALRAKALGYAVRFYDPLLPCGYEKAIGVVRDESLEGLLRAADVVSLHVPLNEQTRHLIGRCELRTMKREAYLINTARGAVVSYEALAEALAEGWIAGAGLDVLEHEPQGLDLVARFPSCILTPHSAFYSQESILEMRRSSADLVRRAILHGALRNVVNGVQHLGESPLPISNGTIS